MVYKGFSLMRKICVVTSGRADYIRFKSAMQAIQANKNLTLQVIVTGAHLLEKYGSTVNQIKNDGFAPSQEIYTILEGENNLTMTKSFGIGIIELATAFSNLKPDLVVSLTDRYEALMTAVTSSFMNIPLVHLQGGEVTGTIDESIRHSCTKLAQWHLTATSQSRARVIRLGEPEHCVFNTGCPSIDLLKNIPIISRDKLIDFIKQNSKDQLRGDLKNRFILFMQHPVTTESAHSQTQIIESMYALYEIDLPVILMWPNHDAGSEEMVQAIRKFMVMHKDHKFNIFKNFEYSVFVNLMHHTSCMVGNSSASIRETPYLGTPVVNIGTRENGREMSINVKSVDYNRNDIIRGINHQLIAKRYEIDEIYGRGDSGKMIASILSELDLTYLQKQITF